MPAARRRARVRRWLLGIAIGIVGLVGLAAIALVLAFHTRWGQSLVRARIEQHLAAAFTGGATLGGIDGDPLGELTLRDLVIRGPDGRPAISARAVTVELGLLPLLSHQARVIALRAEDVEVALVRDARGELAIHRLTKPGPKSTWSVDLQRLAIRRGHVRLDTGGGPWNFDGLALDGWAKLPHGGPIDAGADLRGTWRERASAALALHAVLHAGEHGVALSELSARAGGVSVAGPHVQVDAPAVAGHAPVIGGTLDVTAPAAAVARLCPAVSLPADLALRITATPVPGQPWTQLVVTGRVDHTPVRLAGAADLDAKHARGELSTGALDLARLSGGRIAGTAGGSGAFDVRLGAPGAPGALPTATATLHGWGEVDGVPRTELDLALHAAGGRAHGRIDARGEGVRAALAADLRIAGERLDIERATLHATADPARASGGKAPLRGGLRIELSAHGQVRPAPSLAVQGTIDGRDLRTQEVSASALHVAIDGRQLPARPYGRAHVQLTDVVLVRRNLPLGELTVDAGDRLDGKIAVAIRSRPRQLPWRIDADALVTPPGELGPGRVAIDLVRHRVRTGSGAEWTGHTGHLDIGPDRIALRDLESTSQRGALALAASYQRAGRRTGDLTANLDATSLSLDELAGTYTGKASAHVAVARRGGAWQGEAFVDGKGLAQAPASPAVDAQARVALHGRRLTIAADAASAELGKAKLALDVDAPAAVTDPAAWQRLGRSAISSGELTLRGIEVRRAAALAGVPGDYAGRINADLAISPSDTTGKLEVSHLVAPALRGLPIDAVLELSQPTAAELAAKLTAVVDRTGHLAAQARLALPDRPLDPAAWQALGPGALHGATVRIADVAFDPAVLERFGVSSPLRGRISATIAIGGAGRTLDAAIAIAALRGGPIVQPIDVQLTAGADERATTSMLTVAAGGDQLVAVTGRLPVSLGQLAKLPARPGAIRGIPLSATARLTSVDVARLLAVVGRGEITGGRLDGSVKLAGTIGRPTATASLLATQLAVPPGSHGTPVRTVDRLAVTGAWDGETARLDVAGAESGGGTLTATAVARPDALRGATLAVRAVKFDLAPLLAFAPGPAGGAAGQLDADLKVTGLDLRDSRIAGELHLTGARIPTAPTVGTLRDARIDAVIADREVRLRADGKLGGGSATLDGTIALDGAVPNGGTAKIALRNVSPIGSLEPRITADVTGTLSRDRSRWTADLVVDHGKIVVPKERGEPLKPVGAPPDMRFDGAAPVPGRPVARPVPTSPIFVVKLAIQPTRVESEEFRGEIKGRLELRTDGQALAMLGEVEADGGDLELFGRRYAVERGAVRFDGSLDPLLDIRITHDFPEVTTVTEVHGRVSKPELVMSSDPGTYSQGQLLGFLLGGEPGGEPSGSAGNQAAAAGASYVANQIGGYVKKALPIDVDVLSYQAATSSSSAAVTVGTWIMPSLFVAYRQHLESRPDENTGEAELEYRLTRRIVIEGTIGNRGYDSVDLVWRKRY